MSGVPLFVLTYFFLLSLTLHISVINRGRTADRKSSRRPHEYFRTDVFSFLIFTSYLPSYNIIYPFFSLLLLFLMELKKRKIDAVLKNTHFLLIYYFLVAHASFQLNCKGEEKEICKSHYM